MIDPVTELLSRYPMAEPLTAELMRALDATGNPAQALRLTLNSPAFGVISSGYMTAGTVGAIDANSVVTMLGDLQFLASSNATLHMSDTPTALSVTGSPNTIAAPVSSAFQMDLIALRSTLYVSWAKRRTGATALATSVTW